ncbi:divergent polysaccharide deacetylase family protein [Campylobacter sp. faydin G-24]|uniref:Divergent polysaccharide deacetylase family protein n=1 Tax=Campylobacter anatolicus TaxID=2829105 RepID=A0ABS5HJF2_9BACT|nr:divergent polysaccharide deacetylase family protein [Campylobacter anatolicus]MBR8464399.1 divergent polysaccharide deacetylase family protein [Campylobacter anatolicus]
MNDKKQTIKKRPKISKKNKSGRFGSKIYIGFSLLALLLVITLMVALNSVKNGNNITKTVSSNINKIENNTKNIDTKRQEKPKKEHERLKYPLKFDEDENLSKIFIDPELEPKKQKQKASDKESINISKSQNLSEKKGETKLENLNIDKSKTIVSLPTPHLKVESVKMELNQTKDYNQTVHKIEKSIEETEKVARHKKEEKPQKQKALSPAKSNMQSEKFDGKPRLVIIIDDVATFEHAFMIRSTELKLTPSIFPATKNHPDTPKIADLFEFFMIHLPMQAKSFDHPEIGTLNVNDSFETILKRVQKVRADFPHARYINNHTGSKFTSDFKAMDKAYRAFIQEKFIFIDSKTIATSVVASVASKYSQPYIVRDVFLDDSATYAAVKKELANAVRIAKKRGYAIAIGHPKKSTIQAIKDAKNGILREVEVVYLKDIL